MSTRKDPTHALKKIKQSATGRHSKQKGASFEREVGVLLSEWLTRGVRRDLFSRNVLSGGRFTNALKKEEHERAGGLAGDLMAAHPLAFQFLKLFIVECKHYADIQLHQYLMDTSGKSFLGEVIRTTGAQARHANTEWMVVARQNRMDTLLFMPSYIGMVAMNERCSPPIHLPDRFTRYHMLHSNTIMMVRLNEFLQNVDTDAFLAAISAVHTAV